MQDLAQGRLLEQFFTKLTGIALSQRVQVKSFVVCDLKEYTANHASCFRSFEDAADDDIFIIFRLLNMLTDRHCACSCLLRAADPNAIIGILE